MTQIEKIPFYADELEAFKLCDFDGLTQEDAAVKMGISRATVQRILASARKKTAEALSQCKALVCQQNICSQEEENEIVLSGKGSCRSRK